MTESESCSWLRTAGASHSCALRNQKIPRGEVKAKCTQAGLYVICIDAYSSLSNAQKLLEAKSTDALLWLVEAATQFENLGELDNTIIACIKGIVFANSMNLTDNGYEMFKYARQVYEEGQRRKDPSLSDPSIKRALIKAGQDLIATARESAKGDAMRDMQSELKAAVLGGAQLKKAEKQEDKDLITIDGRQLYAKKLQEYKESAETYIKSGVINNAIVFSCMAALAELMMGRPKEGIEYLAEMAASSGQRERFNEDPCFQWTRLVFKAFVSRDIGAIEEAKTKFLRIPWSFKDDREFARRVMESVHRRISST
ncbi:MAG: hypothetical protein HXY34_11225 [Candidatus Thorarchaeota archaeon]|nr:hypothetical protein [Candidatus Thorarchaeota archaeon]